MRPRGLAALSAPRRYADPLGLGGGNLGATVRYSCRSGRTSWSATAFSRTHLGSERSRWWKTYVLDANRRPADEPTEVCGGALRRPHRAGGRLIAGGSEPPALARFQQPPQRQNHHLPRPRRPRSADAPEVAHCRLLINGLPHLTRPSCPSGLLRRHPDGPPRRTAKGASSHPERSYPQVVSTGLCRGVWVRGMSPLPLCTRPVRDLQPG